MRRALVVVALLVVVVAAVATTAYTDLRSFGSRAMAIPVDGNLLLVPKCASVRQVAENLDERGFLDRPPIYLELLARADGMANRIRAGEYLVPEGATPSGLLQQLVGGRVVQHSLTLIEGWTFREILDAIRSDTTLVSTIDGLEAGEIMARLDAQGVHPEGQFLPDTYHFPKGTTDIEFLRRARSAMQDLLESEWHGRAQDLPLSSPYEALTLASIIEKETGMASERQEIAGVFVRRLKRGMRLQTDPTVIYGLGKSFDGNLRRNDLRTDTPYNTYTRSGLPPTPIAMPGRASVHAALHPADGEALYFVARGDGSHHFSKNLAEHNRAVRKYQLKR